MHENNLLMLYTRWLPDPEERMKLSQGQLSAKLQNNPGSSYFTTQVIILIQIIKK